MSGVWWGGVPYLKKFTKKTSEKRSKVITYLHLIRSGSRGEGGMITLCVGGEGRVFV